MGTVPLRFGGNTIKKFLLMEICLMMLFVNFTVTSTNHIDWPGEELNCDLSGFPLATVCTCAHNAFDLCMVRFIMQNLLLKSQAIFF